MKVREEIGTIFMVMATVLTIAGIYMAFVYAPRHSTMGEVQRIFYFHVASAWVSYLAFGVTFVGSLAYLVNKDMRMDTLAYASAEVGVIFCTLAITTGPLWGKAVWDVYWRWEDLKLFMTLVLWLIFLAYLALRANVPSRKKRASLSAVFGIVGFMCVPLSFAANRIWSQYHPTVIATSEGSLQSSMVHALIVAVFAFTFLYLTLVLKKIELVTLKAKVEEIKHGIGD